MDLNATDYKEGNNVNVSVTVENTGNKQTVYDVKLIVDGDLIHSSLHTLSMYMMETIYFPWTAEKGTHNITVRAELQHNASIFAENSTTIYIEPGFIDPSNPVLWGIILIPIIIAIAVIIVIRKKRELS